MLRGGPYSPHFASRTDCPGNTGSLGLIGRLGVVHTYSTMTLAGSSLVTMTHMAHGQCYSHRCGSIGLCEMSHTKSGLIARAQEIHVLARTMMIKTR